MENFDLYIAAQKMTGIRVAVFGIVLLVAAVLLHFSQLNPITQGVRNSFFILSILLLASGTGFIMNQHKLLKTKTQAYQTDKLDFEKQEVYRMQQVNKSVPNVILGLSIAMILLILALIFFIHQPFWKGISFGVLIYFLGLTIFESISYLSVKNYLESLIN